MSLPDALPPSIPERLAQVQRRICAACLEAGRPPGSVGLIAVSKRQPPEAIRTAFAAGQRVFGESYVQEALDKQAALQDLDIAWHFIGRIQANKTRPIAERFDWIHGLSDPDHARRLSDRRPTDLPPIRVCLQVNLDGESSKSGASPETVGDLLATCMELPGLRVEGLMALPAPRPDFEGQREPFRALRLLRNRLATPACPLECLSMGMSEDLEPAILEGATLVRIGTAVFGSRPYNASPKAADGA